MHPRDFTAGLSVAGLMLPEAVAYAGIAGLPPQHAILAGIAGCLAYAVVGRSRFAVVSPTSSSAAILGATLAAIATDPGARAALAAIAVALTGVLFLVAALLRLGTMTGFVSRPVLRGFAFGLAIIIILKQVPALTGVEFHGSNLFELVVAVGRSLPRWNVASVATGVVALAALLLFRRLPVLPGAFIVLCGGILASMAFDLPAHGVAVVGEISLMPSRWMLPPLSQDTLLRLAELIPPLVLVLFAESWGTMRALALRHGDTIEPNRELRALGVANLAAALVRGMPVGAGFSAGSASEAAGATSRATGALAALGVVLLMLFGSRLVAHLPEPVLAAVVVAALTHALDPRPLLRLWTLRRDNWIALGAVAGVLVLGVVNGMLFAIALSLVALIRRMATPQVVRLGRLGTGHDFVDVDRHPEAVVARELAIWRPGEPLFFANAEPVLQRVMESIEAAPAVRAVILSLEETFDLDSTALDALLEFNARLRTKDIALHLARVRDDVSDLLAAAGAQDLAGRCSYSVDDAVAAATASS